MVLQIHSLVFIPAAHMDKIQLIYFLSSFQCCQSSSCLPTKWLQSGFSLLVLICIFLITSHVNYLSVCLLAVCVSFSGRSLLASLPTFLSCLFISYCFVGVHVFQTLIRWWGFAEFLLWVTQWGMVSCPGGADGLFVCPRAGRQLGLGARLF